MSAITEMPANTPKPMGNTFRLFPGTAAAARAEVAVVVTCAASAVGDVSEASLPCEFEFGLLLALLLLSEPELAWVGAVLVPESVLLATDAVDESLELELEAAPVDEDPSAVTVLKPFTEMAPLPPLPPDDVEAEPLAAPLSAPLLDPLFVLLADPLVSAESLQSLTSSNAGFPLESVIGVRVITQVCSMGPTGVVVVCTVWTVTVCPFWRTLSGSARVDERQEDRMRVAKRKELIMENILSS